MTTKAKWNYLRGANYKTSYPPKSMHDAIRADKYGWPHSNQGSVALFSLWSYRYPLMYIPAICQQSEFVVERRVNGRPVAKSMANWGVQWWPTVLEAYEHHVREVLGGVPPELSESEMDSDRDTDGERECAAMRSIRAKRSFPDQPGDGILADTLQSLASLEKEVALQPKKQKKSLESAHAAAGEYGQAAKAEARRLIAESAARARDLEGFFSDDSDGAPRAAAISGRGGPAQSVETSLLDSGSDGSSESVDSRDMKNSVAVNDRPDPLKDWGRSAAISVADSFNLCGAPLGTNIPYQLPGLK